MHFDLSLLRLTLQLLQLLIGFYFARSSLLGVGGFVTVFGLERRLPGGQLLFDGLILGLHGLVLALDLLHFRH